MTPREEREAWIERRQPRPCRIEEVFVESGGIYWACRSTVAGFICGKCGDGRLTRFPKEGGTCTSCNSEIAVRYEDHSGGADRLVAAQRR